MTAANIVRIWDPEVGERTLNLPTPTAGGTPTLLGLASLVLTADPGVNQDSTQGYVVGSVVFNATAGQLRTWWCRDNTAGAAKWILSGVDYANGGTNPASEVTQFGLSSALMAEEGNINRLISLTGVQPGAINVDSVLAVYTLPANAFDVAGRGLAITSQGSFGLTGNNKRVKLIIGATTAVVGQTIVGGSIIADTGVVVTNGGGWSLQANVFKAGAAGANTQLALHQQSQVGAAVAALLAPSSLTLVENAAILIAVTGNAPTAVSDIVHNFLEVNAMN